MKTTNATPNAQHTPGPWSVIRCDNGNITITYSCGELRSHVATCYDTALAPEHGSLEANARLIASCPDLLQVAEDFALLAKLHDWEGAAIDNCLAVLARAKGQA